MPDWIIYYIGNKTFSSLDGGPEEAPGDGCLAIAQLDTTVGYRIMHGGGPHYNFGFYWWEKDCWFVGNREGLMQYQRDPGWKKVILGRTVIHNEWLEVLGRIEAVFGPKTSYWPNEPRRDR